VEVKGHSRGEGNGKGRGVDAGKMIVKAKCGSELWGGKGSHIAQRGRYGGGGGREAVQGENNTQRFGGESGCSAGIKKALSKKPWEISQD